MEPHSPFERLVRHWVYGGTLAGVLLLVLTPILSRDWSGVELLTFLVLPAYMLHQWEEHDDDRFRRFVNAELGAGAEVLTRADVFWINVLFVWFVMAGVIALTFRVDPGWAALAGWLVVVNGLLHLVQALALRKANPGLWTGVIVFLPLGLATLGAAEAAGASLAQQGISLLAILVLHAGIVLRVAQKRRRAGA